MVWVRQLAVGLVLMGCGGRASGSGQPNETGAQGGNPGTAGTGASNVSAAGGLGSASGGASGAGTVLLVDDEVASDGRPGVPSSAAFFWGSPRAGWRLGNWFLTSDGVYDVELSPFAPARDGSMQARRVSGSGFASGVVLWAELDHPLHRPVDLSAYSGITFWARLESKSGVLAVAAENEPGRAVMAEGRDTLPVVVSLDVGPDWQQFTLPFDELFQGEPQAASIDFFAGAGGEAFELWIDDLAFLCTGACL